MNIQCLVFSLNIQISENSYCAELITNIFLTWNCFHYLININKWKLQSSEFKDLRSCVTMSQSHLVFYCILSWQLMYPSSYITWMSPMWLMHLGRRIRRCESVEKMKTVLGGEKCFILFLFSKLQLIKLIHRLLF